MLGPFFSIKIYIYLEMQRFFCLLAVALLCACSLLDSDSSSELEDAAVHDASNREGYADFIDSATVLPKFFLPSAGFYSPFVLRAPKAEAGGIVRCTFDGSEPTTKTPLFDSLSVNTSTVVTCYEFLNDSIAIKSTQTYFINESLEMAVVSMRVDPEYMREYLDYPPCSQGVCERFKDETEYPVHLEFFANGSSSKMKNFEFDAGIKIAGASSRNRPKKSVAVTMRSQYQKGRLHYPLFKIRKNDDVFKSLLFRNNGTRFDMDYVADAAASSLVEGTGLDYQRSRQVVVFYNGVFHGIYDMRERLNEHFIETNYGIEADKVDFLKLISNRVYVANGSDNAYRELQNFIWNNDFSQPNSRAYDSLGLMMDLDNYAYYMAAQIYFRNFDWPQNNVRVWKALDGRWKFILYDLDAGIDWNWDVILEKMNIFDWIRRDEGDLQYAGVPLPPLPEEIVKKKFHYIYKVLSKNPDFKRKFINQAALLYGYYLNSEKFSQAVDRMVASLGEIEIQRDLKLYPRGGPKNNCGENFSVSGSCMKLWVRYRDAWVRQEFKDEFGLGADIQVTIGSVGNGMVLLDGVRLPEIPYTGSFFGGNAMLLTATPMGGATFVSWEDGSTENPRLVLPSNGSTYQASFK